MYDFGEQHRKQFLEEEKVNRKHERQAYWLLLILSIYVIIHMSIYLWRTYAI
jgi:accessory gene regulator protein AgrB